MILFSACKVEANDQYNIAFYLSVDEIKHVVHRLLITSVVLDWTVLVFSRDAHWFIIFINRTYATLLHILHLICVSLHLIRVCDCNLYSGDYARPLKPCLQVNRRRRVMLDGDDLVQRDESRQSGVRDFLSGEAPLLGCSETLRAAAEVRVPISVFYEGNSKTFKERHM